MTMELVDANDAAPEEIFEKDGLEIRVSTLENGCKNISISGDMHVNIDVDLKESEICAARVNILFPGLLAQKIEEHIIKIVGEGIVKKCTSFTLDIDDVELSLTSLENKK